MFNTLFLSALPALADVSLLVPFASKHYGCNSHKHNCDFEQFNPGLGAEWSPQEYPWGRPIVRGAVYRDSAKKTAYYAAAGWRKDFNVAGDFKWEWVFTAVI
ncbi:hypothetical protein [Chromobacterium violaceum]|uniref:hypothetical protein n=1 Tax=Chromobacterium violaceum TaxID=536 RepID=UPI0005BA4BFF|nr:hypothetical protein [Chromobacterium violaceum]